MIFNPWRVLGVNRQTNDDDIRAAYLGLAKRFHPDTKKGNKDRFVEVNDAYHILSDSKRRSAYIQTLVRTSAACGTCKGQGVAVKRKGFHAVSSCTCLVCSGAGLILDGRQA